MDELDQKLVVELQKNSRQSNRHLSEILEVDEATVKRRIENLVSSGDLIFTALTDLKALGYPIHCFCYLHVNHMKWKEIGNALCQIPYIHFACFCIGFANFFIRGDFSSIEHLKNFIENDLGKIAGIESVDTAIEYEELKRTYYRIEDPYLHIETPHFLGGIIINEIDRKLISCLQINSRASLKELAHFVGVSSVTVHRRIKELTNSGLLQPTVIPGNIAYDSSMRCNISIQTEPSEVRPIAESLCTYPETVYVGLLSSPNQVFVGVHTPSIQDFSNFMVDKISKTKGILKIEFLVHLNLLKRTFTSI